MNPKWKKSIADNKILLVADNVPSVTTQKIKDSLQIKQVFNENQLLKLAQENPNLKAKIFLLGQDFSPFALSKLYNQTKTWIPYFEPDKLREVFWSGVIRKGAIQKVSGEIESSKSQSLKIKYGNITLDSLKLKKGFNHFELSFPVFALGRNRTNLFLDNDSLTNIHFFSQGTQPISIQFILENPDFEAKTLAEWLGKQGHQVKIITQTTKNTTSQISINKQNIFEPDLIITTPANADNTNIKKALTAGKSVLFIGLSNPEKEIKNLPLQINLRRTTNEENIKIADNLTAQPFAFIPKTKQKILADYPVLVQKSTNKIAVSLLNETFPLKLSGDTLAYSKIWASILQQLQPDFKDNVLINAPILQDSETKIRFNYLSKNIEKIKIENEPLEKQASAINVTSTEINHVFRNSGWQPLADSMEVYVDKWTINNGQWIKTLSISHSQNHHSSLIIHHSSFSDWFWFFLILFCLAVLWIEPKIRK